MEIMDSETFLKPEYRCHPLPAIRISPRRRQQIARRLISHSVGASGEIASYPADKPWLLKNLQLEVINRCNFRCALCRTNQRDWVPRRRLSPEEAEAILAPVAENLEVVTLYGTRGEPLLHRRLEAIVAHIKSRTRAKVRLSTNGSLVSERRARALLDAGLDQIVFAVDGLTQQTYGEYRRGGRLKEVLENLRTLCRIKNQNGYSTRVVFQFIPMAANEHEVPEVGKFAYALGVDTVKLKYSVSACNSPVYRSVQARLRTPTEGMQRFECPLGLDNLYIDPNGYCYPCCYMEGYPNMLVGNALSENLTRIWNKPEMWELRRSFADQNGFNRFCASNCRGVSRGHKKILPRPEP